jgi:hypothetical protein
LQPSEPIRPARIPVRLRQIFGWTLTLFGLSFFLSCEYSPTETNYRQVNLPEPNINFMILDSTQLNVLRGDVRIQYQAAFDGHTFRRGDLLIDSTLATGAIGNDTGYFQLNTSGYSDGEHTLRFVFTLATNSGSLADRVGAEVFIMSRTYSTYFFNAAVQPPEILGFDTAHGALRIRWEKYDQIGFTRYMLSKNGIEMAVIKDINQQELVDSTFVGWFASYQLTTYAGGSALGTSYKSITAPIDSFVSFVILDDRNVQLNWRRCIYDSAFASYRILRRRYLPNLWYETLAEIPDINQTSFIDDNPVVGGGTWYGLAVLPRGGNPSPGQSAIEISPIGRRFSLPYNPSHLE